MPPLLHIDLYRISGPEEFLLLGVDEQFGDSVTLVEWPERAEGALENPDFVVEITICSTGERTISILPDPELNP